MRSFVFLLVLLISSPAHTWDGKTDKKSVDELQLMTEEELAQEAAIVCISGANPTRDSGSGAADYLSTIGRVARTKAKSTKMPYWALSFIEAVAKKEGDLCIETMKAYYDGHPKKQTKE